MCSHERFCVAALYKSIYLLILTILSYKQTTVNIITNVNIHSA